MGEIAPDSVPEEQRLQMGAGMTNVGFLGMLKNMLGPDGETARLDAYSGFFPEDISPEEWAVVEEYVAKAALEPSVALEYTGIGTFGNGNGLVDIAINNVLAAGVPLLGIALRPGTARGYRYTQERKEEVETLGGCDFTIVDLSVGLPDDQRAHFSFWLEETKDIQEEVSNALVDFAHSSLYEECAELPDAAGEAVDTSVEMSMPSTSASVRASASAFLAAA